MSNERLFNIIYNQYLEIMEELRTISEREERDFLIGEAERLAKILSEMNRKIHEVRN